MIRADYVLGVKVNGRPRIVGKVLRIGQTSVFHRQYRESVALFRKWDALSFDKRVADYLVGKVQYIHCEHSGTLYTIPFDDFMAKAVVGNHGEAEQLYLAKDAWVTRKMTYKVPWTNREVWL